MTRQQAKLITMTKCLFRQVHLDGTYVNPYRHYIEGDFELLEFCIVSTPIFAEVIKLKPDAMNKIVVNNLSMIHTGWFEDRTGGKAP